MTGHPAQDRSKHAASIKRGDHVFNAHEALALPRRAAQKRLPLGPRSPLHPPSPRRPLATVGRLARLTGHHFVCRVVNRHKWKRFETPMEEAYRCVRCGGYHYRKLNQAGWAPSTGGDAGGGFGGGGFDGGAGDGG
jgi:hypothetical protein